MSLEIGSKLPSARVITHGLDQVDLAEELSGHKAVVLFFPAAFTGVCQTELCTFQSALARYGELGAKVVGLSVDLPFSQKVFAEQNDVAFPLYSDFNKEAIKAFGVVFADLKGLKDVARRSVFVADAEGTVTWRWLSDSPGDEPEYDAVRAAVEAI